MVIESRRRYVRRAGLLLGLSTAGCAGIVRLGNCDGFRREATVGSISERHLGEQLTLAGKIIDRQPEAESVLIDDGTGIVEAVPSRGAEGEFMVSRPSGECQSFSGEVESLSDSGRVDVVLVKAGHETQE